MCRSEIESVPVARDRARIRLHGRECGSSVTRGRAMRLSHALAVADKRGLAVRYAKMKLLWLSWLAVTCASVIESDPPRWITVSCPLCSNCRWL